jgi:hypothetical protein
MAVSTMEQTDVHGTRHVDVKGAGSPAEQQRLHSEPAYSQSSQRLIYSHHVRRAASAPDVASNPHAILPTDKLPWSQPLTLGSSVVHSVVGNNAVVATHEHLSDSPNTTGTVPRVVQPVVSPCASTVSADQESVHHMVAGEREITFHLSAAMADMPFTSKPRHPDHNSRPGSGPGPGPGPGHGPGPDKRSTDLLRAQSNSTLTIQYPAMSLHKEWQRIRKLRTAVSSLRSQAQFRRRELRVKEQAKSMAEDRLMRYLQVNSANQGSIEGEEPISTLLQDWQRIRDEYGPLADDCILLEDRLNRDEHELTRLEESFYQRADRTDMQAELNEAFLPSPDWDPSASSVYSDQDIREDYHPLVAEYLSKLGDVDILQERLAIRREEKYELENEKESRLRVGLGLAIDEQALLDDYDASDAELLRKIEAAEEEAEKLRKQCFSYGLIDDDGNATSFESWEKQNFSHETDVSAGSETSEFTKFPALLPRYGTTDIRIEDPEPADEQVYNTGDRINHWLLIHLRSSPLDVSLLARTYESLFGPIEGLDEWQKRVLNLWYEDGTRDGHDYRIYSSEGLTHNTPHVSRLVEAGDGESGTMHKPLSQEPHLNSPTASTAQKDELLLIGLSSGPLRAKDV